jgi:alkylglycerol monooxygenase
MSKVILYASPVFFALIALEYWWGLKKGRNTYRLVDAMTSIGLGLMSQFSGVLTRLLRVGIYVAVYSTVSLVPQEAATAFWSSPLGWVSALLFYDLCYYWHHRSGHETAIFWAAHSVHHQSQDYNLSTALRQTSTGALVGWFFYLPMAIAGVPPVVFGAVALIDLLYQYWVHTEHIGKLGWFDRWFVSPSNHRVHHAVNDEYLDKNYGGILIVWDRLFGSFKEESAACVYGTRTPLLSWDPLWANLEGYAAIAHKMRHAPRWRDKLLAIIKPPGWQPVGMPGHSVKPDFNLHHARLKFERPVSGFAQGVGIGGFLAMLAATVAFLWFAGRLPMPALWVGVIAMSVMLWLTGGVLQARLHPCVAIAGFFAVLATCSSAYLGMPELRESHALWQVLHWLSKPCVMLFAIIYVANYLIKSTADGIFGIQKLLLLAALVLSMAGDVLLMLPGLFVPGLVAFLVAHLAYIGLFTRQAPWFASRAALLACLIYAAAMYAWLWIDLPAGLRVPVAAYVLVIACMGAQVLGAVLSGHGAKPLAAAALLFMLSDSILAVNKFIMPVPLAPLWILSTYFMAQLLFAHFALRHESVSA